MITVIRIAGGLILMAALAAQAADTAPEALVKSTVDEVLAVIKQTRDRRALVDLAEKKVLPHFDFKHMTRLAVGRSWSQANAAQQEVLERGFRTLLMRTYTAALSQSSGGANVEVKPSPHKPGNSETVVRTLVSEPGRKPFSIDYRMRNGTGGWKVYDVVVENLSLVTNYRGSFQSEISRSGIEGLIKAIESKNRQQG
ncbi:MAG: ABC transporter substrate-binding protein [Betaproteobacteria bacterium]|nr:ABC transporter substrate-binding protein [Betaproteobacteria bacterium]